MGAKAENKAYILLHITTVNFFNCASGKGGIREIARGRGYYTTTTDITKKNIGEILSPFIPNDIGRDE